MNEIIRWFKTTDYCHRCKWQVRQQLRTCLFHPPKWPRVKWNVCSKCRVMLTKGVTFYNDNFWPPQGSSNCWNGLRTEISDYPSPSIQWRSCLIWSPYFSTTWRCYMDTNIQVMKRSKMQSLCGFACKIKPILVHSTMKILDQSNKCAEKLWDYFKNWRCICYCALIAG